MMPTRLSTSRTADRVNLLQSLSAAQWSSRVPIETVETILAQLNQTTKESTLTRIESLRIALAQLVNGERFQTRPSPHNESDTEIRALIELAQAISDAQVPQAFEMMFDQPSTRLAVYGSLRPGESNFDQLAMVQGGWQDGTVKGRIKKPEEYLEFTWDVSSPAVAVKVLTAARLSDHFDRLDEFEGDDYRRILVPVMIAEKVRICHIYEGVRP